MKSRNLGPTEVQFQKVTSFERTGAAELQSPTASRASVTTLRQSLSVSPEAHFNNPLTLATGPSQLSFSLAQQKSYSRAAVSGGSVRQSFNSFDGFFLFFIYRLKGWFINWREYMDTRGTRLCTLKQYINIQKDTNPRQSYIRQE